MAENNNSKLKKDWIDRALYHINPEAAYNRIAWKMGVRSFDAGSLDRTNSTWVAVNTPAEQVNQTQRDLIRARSRDLEINADVMRSIIGAYLRNVVGIGLKLQAQPKDENGEIIEELAVKFEELFKSWEKSENCDITGRSTFGEMQQLAIRRQIVDGGLIFVLSDNPYENSDFSLILQIREVDEIDATKFSYNLNNSKNRIINGIELNEYNKPVAYYLKTITPDGLTLGDSKRIPAERVIYLNDIIRPSQIREIPQMSSTLNRIKDLNEFTEAISIKERVLACLSVFIKKNRPAENMGRSTSINSSNTDTKTGYETQMLSPGLVTELNPGDDVAVVNPSGQASNAKDFISAQQRLAGSGEGLSYETVSRDMSQVNYSSARQGLIEDDKTYDDVREYLKKHFLEVVYREFITQCVLQNKIKIDDFFTNKERYLQHEWIAPGRTWIDPLKETKANETALNSNQTTLAKICAASGVDWRENIKQRAKEQAYAKQLGLDNAQQKGGQTNATVKKQ